MTLNEFEKIAMRIQSMYPKENILHNDYTLSLWYKNMADLDYKTTENALDYWQQTQQWSPSLSNIRETYNKILNGDYSPWPTEWEKVEYAVRSKYGRYRKEEALNSFTDITRRCVLALGWDNLCNSENIMADRAHFGRIYEELSFKTKERSQLSEPIRNLVDIATKRREQLEIKMEQSTALPEKKVETKPEGEIELSKSVQEGLRKLREGLRSE